jgi:hypothetical protein
MMSGMLTFLVSAAFAQDLNLTNPADIDLGPGDQGGLTYEGGLSGAAAAYAPGKPLSVSHSNGNVAVRCMDTDKLSARLQYTVYGNTEGPMESFGKGIGLQVSGDSKGGAVRTRVPQKTSGVTGAQVDLTVNVPKGTTSLVVTQTGRGWVQVLDCSGNVTVSAGAGGAYVSGAVTGGKVSASGGDVKVVTDKDTVLKGALSVAAPGGNVTLSLPPAQGGKINASGGEVVVQQTVMGTNTGTVVSGDLGIAGPQITVSAKNRIEVGQD